MASRGLARPRLLLTAMFAGRALGEAAQKVRARSRRSQLEAARQALRSLCSRDPKQLSEADLIGASIESIAENASDSFVAPLFYYVLFGLPGAVLYRVVNTLDAMLGYRGHYEYLGKASARLDDALNFIPARITAALLLVAGLSTRANVRELSPPGAEMLGPRRAPTQVGPWRRWRACLACAWKNPAITSSVMRPSRSRLAKSMLLADRAAGRCGRGPARLFCAGRRRAFWIVLHSMQRFSAETFSVGPPRRIRRAYMAVCMTQSFGR